MRDEGGGQDLRMPKRKLNFQKTDARKRSMRGGAHVVLTRMQCTRRQV